MALATRRDAYTCVVLDSMPKAPLYNTVYSITLITYRLMYFSDFRCVGVSYIS